MKTRLFYTISTNRDIAPTFIRDSQTLLTMDEEIRDALLELLAKLGAEAMTEREWVNKLEELAQERTINVVNVTSAMQVLRLLMRQLSDEDYRNASTEDLLEDFVHVAKDLKVELTLKQKEDFRHILEHLRSKVIPQYESIKERKSTVSGVLPSITSFGTSVELRAIVKNRFHIGMKSAEYDPEIVDLVPVASISLGVDSGPVKSFSFQTSEEELEALIQELLAAQKCLQKLKKR